MIAVTVEIAATPSGPLPYSVATVTLVVSGTTLVGIAGEITVAVTEVVALLAEGRGSVQGTALWGSLGLILVRG